MRGYPAVVAVFVTSLVVSNLIAVKLMVVGPLTLPAAVVPDKAEAKFKDGILVIRVPKANQSRMMKLKVKTD